MIELQLLGTLDLTADSEHPDASAILAKPKLTGLLCYLLVGKGEAWCRRDELATMFWPESDQQHARRALSQAIYQLRQSLGADVIESRGTEDVRVDNSIVCCDAVKVRRILSHDAETAMAAYAGDLLPAFHLPDGGPFTDWLDRERESIRRALTEAALGVAKKTPDRADLRRAARWAVEHNLLNGEVTRRAMRLLAERREQAAALELFDEHAEACRRELEGEPGADVITLAAVIRDDPGHFTPLDIAMPRSKATATLPVPSPDVVPPVERPEQPQNSWRGRIVSLVSVTAVVTVLVGVGNRLGTDSPSNPGTVVVLPWSYEGPQSDRFLAAALPLELLPRFDGTAGLRAVTQAQTGSMLASIGASWKDALGSDQERELAKALGAESYLSATLMSDGLTRQVTATVISTETGRMVHRVQVALDHTDRNASLDRLYVDLLLEHAGLAARATHLRLHSLAALRPYIDAHMARHDQRYLEALRGYRAAMEQDSTFALAALGYQEVSAWLEDGTPQREFRLRADRIARRFVANMPRADSAVSEAIFATGRLEYDGDHAFQVIREATIIAPDRPLAWLTLGDFLLHDGAMLDRADHVDRAREAFDSVLALGDTIPEALRHLAEIRFASHDSVFARDFLGRASGRLTHWQHLTWLARSLSGDTTARHAFGPNLATVARDTLRLMVLWSQRATTALDDGDQAAGLLHNVHSIDAGTWFGDQMILEIYALNRGRPAKVVRTTDAHGSGIHGSPKARLLLASLLAPDGWLPRDSIALDMQDRIGAANPEELLQWSCTLGLWNARWGSGTTARLVAKSLEAWWDDPRKLFDGYARACQRVVIGLVVGRNDLSVLVELAAYLRTEPVRTLRSDISAWNLLTADAMAALGRPDLAQQLTTRLGYIVEDGWWLTPALLREADWSLAVGDSARAGRIYRRLAALLSDPEPALKGESGRVRLAGQQLR